MDGYMTSVVKLLMIFTLLTCISACQILKKIGEYNGVLKSALVGNELKTFPTPSFHHCFRICVYSTKCKSVNWEQDSRLCRLYGRVAELEDDLAPAPRGVYLPVTWNQMKQTPCNPSPCAETHVCIPVTSNTGKICLPLFDDTSKVEKTTESQSNTTVTTTVGFTVTSTTPSLTSAVTITSTTVPGSTTTPLTSTTSAPTRATTTPNNIIITTPTTTSATTPTSTTSITTTTTTTTSTTAPGGCTTDDDCAKYPDSTCVDGNCTCGIGYQIDPNQGNCRDMRECQTFEDTFILFSGKAIVGQDKQRFRDTTPTDCIPLCTGASSYVCKSYELYRGDCYTQEIVWFEASENVRKAMAAVDHYQRKCVW